MQRPRVMFEPVPEPAPCVAVTQASDRPDAVPRLDVRLAGRAVAAPGPAHGQARRAARPKSPDAARGNEAAPAAPALRSEDVLRGRRSVDILHAGARYRLSLTSMGKLILTK